MDPKISEDCDKLSMRIGCVALAVAQRWHAQPHDMLPLPILLPLHTSRSIALCLHQSLRT